jgi:flagellar M-ring protein FliF
MNALNEFGKQISDLFASMTPQARVMAGLMLGMIVVSLGWIISSGNSTQYEYLFGGKSFSDAELERWEATFGESQLRDYDRVGKRIRVPAGQKDLYLKALSSANVLPKEWGGYIDAAMQSGGPFDPKNLIDFRNETARERELANIIKRTPGIEFAAVEFDQQQTGFARNTDRVCSISVQGLSNTAIPVRTLKAIAEMVMASFAGLKKESIVVTDLGTMQTYRANDDPNSSEENPYLKAQLEFESSYHDKISRILEGPFGTFQLGVNVKLDPKLMEESEQLKYDPAAVTLQTIESRRDLDNTKGAPAGVPGSATNGVSNQPQSVSSTASNQISKTKESEASEKRVASHEATVTRMAPMVPVMVNVSVGLPDSYYDKVWAIRFVRENPDKVDEVPPRPTPLELTALKAETETAIQAAVEGIPVGVRQGDESKTFVKVYSYTDMPPPEYPEASLAQNAVAWLTESWSTVALLLIVLVSLGMMFSWVKSQSSGEEVERRFAEGFGLQVPDNIADELELSGETEETFAEDGTPIPGSRAKPAFELSGEEIKDDLSSLIKENPDAAVNLLKTWIGEAA